LFGMSVILNSAGKDVSLNFIRGAEESYKIAELFSADFAIL